MKCFEFIQAKPVWPNNLQEQMNLHIRLRAHVSKAGADMLRLATSGFYQLFINDAYVAYGPARAGKGHFRVDEIDISPMLIQEINVIDILVVSYGVCNFSNIYQEPFVTCEISKENVSIYATGHDGFEYHRMTNYVQSISRYSYQRGFSESYIIDDEHQPEPIQVEIGTEKKYLERHVAYPLYEKTCIKQFIWKGNCRREKRTEYPRLHAEARPIEYSMRFPEPEENMTFDLQEFEYENIVKCNKTAVSLTKGEFAIGELKRELTGMISFRCRVKEKALLYVTYDEQLTNGVVDALRLGCNAAVRYELQKGDYELLSFEPGSMKYISFSLFEGDVEIEDVNVVEYKHPLEAEKIKTEDETIQCIYDAAVETFKQNAVDIFMDCPSRERAGWLCDSFFEGRTEWILAGNNLIERNFLENFLMEEPFAYLPKGMFPMCYPATHLLGEFIPNWAMWLVLELAEYYERTKDEELIEEFRERILQLVEYYEKFENADGLLEKLEGWIFVDWSESNNLVQDINFPSNMMYAYMLEKIAGLYGYKQMAAKAIRLKDKIRTLSFDGRFFCDNLIRTEEGYKKGGVCTESCQYYAFFTNTATEEMYPELWKTLIEEFGSRRVQQGRYPEIPPSNAFIGNFLRLELLARHGLYEQLLDNIKGYFEEMARQTGTLWEMYDVYASKNHGFEGYIAVWIHQCLSKGEE